MKRILFIAITALITTVCAPQAQAQYYSVRVNALALATGTLNAGIDIAVSEKLSLDFSCYYNPIKTGSFRSCVAAVQPGVRYWFYSPHIGSFIGSHLSAANYDVGGKERHNKGFLAGIGFSYGHCWLLSTRWNLGVEIGVGVFYMRDTRRQYDTPYTEDEYIYHNRRFTLAPSKAEVSFSYLF